MPSTLHQTLLLWIVRKMTADGFLVTGSDGRIPQDGLYSLLPTPPEIAGVRPDAWGVARTGEVAFGEAKTLADITSSHTRRQLRAIGRVLQWDAAKGCRLYLAVPRSAVDVLDRALGEVGLLGARQVVRLHIPDCFLTEIRDECA